MGSATTFDAGTEEFLAPEAGSPLNLAPYDWDERVIWAFNKGLASRASTDGAVIGFTQTMLSPGGEVLFSAGCLVGVGAGAWQAVTDYVAFVTRTLHLFADGLKVAASAFDPKLILGSVKVYSTAPGTEERAAALEQVAQYWDQTYPEAAAAVRSVNFLGQALEQMVDWLTTPEVFGQITVAIAGALGDLVATLIEGVRPYLGDPQKLGRAIGYLLGQLIMWAVFDLLGLPFSLALDVLATVAESGRTR